MNLNKTKYIFLLFLSLSVPVYSATLKPAYSDALKHDSCTEAATRISGGAGNFTITCIAGIEIYKYIIEQKITPEIACKAPAIAAVAGVCCTLGCINCALGCKACRRCCRRRKVE